MNDKPIKSQVIKTEDFYVGKKHDKKMYLLNKSNLVFNKIANVLDLQYKKEQFKKERSKVQRESRIAKRIYYYEFYLFETDYDYKKIDSTQNSSKSNLNKNDFKIDDNNIGIFKGSELILIEFLDSLYEEKI